MIAKSRAGWRTFGFWAKLCAGVAIVLLAVFVGGISWLRWNARAQRVAVAAIKDARGRVEYDWEKPDAVVSSAGFAVPGFSKKWLMRSSPSAARSEGGGPGAPPWLVSLLGVDCFGQVTSVSLPRRAPDELLQHVGRLKRLTTLRLDNLVDADQGVAFLEGLDCLEELTLVRSRLGQGAMSHLAGLKKLQSLNLHGTNVDNDGLAHIAGLTALTDLNLNGTAIDGAGLASLQGLTNLRDLDLDGTAIGDTGLSVVGKLPALTRLSLNGTRLIGVGLVHLKGLKRLEELSLEGTGVRDFGLAYLSGLTNLKVLELNGTPVGDAGLKCLAGLTNLEELTLDSTAITDAGLAHLTLLPHLVIVSMQDTKVTDAGITEMKRRRAAAQAQQLAATSNGIAHAAPAITDVEIVR